MCVRRLFPERAGAYNHRMTTPPGGAGTHQWPATAVACSKRRPSQPATGPLLQMQPRQQGAGSATPSFFVLVGVEGWIRRGQHQARAELGAALSLITQTIVHACASSLLSIAASSMRSSSLRMVISGLRAGGQWLYALWGTDREVWTRMACACTDQSTAARRAGLPLWRSRTDNLEAA